MGVNRRFAITGGIGSGKSYVASLLRDLKFPVFDCDTSAKEIMSQNVQLQCRLSKLIGKSVLLPNGTLDKSAIAEYLFRSDDNQFNVNSLVHPLVEEAFELWTNQFDSQTSWIGMESSILFESGFDVLVDFIITVFAPESLRLNRVVRRDGVTVEQVKERMSRQLSEEKKMERSQFIIYNDGQHDISSQLDNLLNIFYSWEK